MIGACECLVGLAVLGPLAAIAVNRFRSGKAPNVVERPPAGAADGRSNSQ